MSDPRTRLATAIARTLGAPVASLRPLSGGDINEAFEVVLADGRSLFAKANKRAPARMFAVEAHGLSWLAEANALRVPMVIAASSDGDAEGDGFLLLERIQAGSKARDFDEQLGRGLAAVHRAGATTFGLGYDNFIGRLPQDNRAADDPGWATFYRQRRLEPQLASAARMGLASAALRKDFERLFARLPSLVGPDEPPARLHGDLWAGNHLVDERGAPVLIDPAVYGGHREVDLAMMRLFGGYGARVFAAYAESFPLAYGHEERVALYQLYPLMVHVNLFGGAYVGGVQEALGTLL